MNFKEVSFFSVAGKKNSPYKTVCFFAHTRYIVIEILLIIFRIPPNLVIIYLKNAEKFLKINNGIDFLHQTFGTFENENSQKQLKR